MVILLSLVVGPQEAVGPRCDVMPGTDHAFVTDGQFRYSIGKYTSRDVTEQFHRPETKDGKSYTAIVMPIPGTNGNQFFEIWRTESGEVMGYQHYPKGKIPKELADKLTQLRKFAASCRSDSVVKK